MDNDNKEAAKHAEGAGAAGNASMKRVAGEIQKLADRKEVADDRPAALVPKHGNNSSGNKNKGKNKNNKFNFKSDKPALKGYPKDVKDDEGTMSAKDDAEGKG